MLIVSGRLNLAPGTRDRFLDRSRDAIVAARGAPGCRDFVVAADPLEPDRVNVYEEWESTESLEAFRGDGPTADLSESIVAAEVRRHQIASSGPA